MAADDELQNVVMDLKGIDNSFDMKNRKEI
jgi:hypothetical protein